MISAISLCLLVPSWCCSLMTSCYSNQFLCLMMPPYSRLMWTQWTTGSLTTTLPSIQIKQSSCWFHADAKSRRTFLPSISTMSRLRVSHFSLGRCGLSAVSGHKQASHTIHSYWHDSTLLLKHLVFVVVVFFFLSLSSKSRPPREGFRQATS